MSNIPAQLLQQTALELDAATLAELTRSDPELPAWLESVALWQISYRSDELTIAGFLAHPRMRLHYPCLIYNRGGTGDAALTPTTAAPLLARIAAWGYLVIASNYRGSPGSMGNDEFGGQDLQDILQLFPLLKQVPFADPNRIGMWGWSRGGLMAYRALAHTERIAAAIIQAGVTDAFDYVARRPEMEQEVFARLIPHYQQQRTAELTRRSAIHWPEQLCKSTPLLLIHGSADWRVDPTQTLRMATKLYEQQHPFRLVIFEGGDHALTEFREELFALAREWLDRYVRDRRSWLSLQPHGV